MLTKKGQLMLSGSLLVGFGVFMFFKSTMLTSFGFYRIGRISTGGILIALILLDVVLWAATGHKLTKIAMPLLICMLILSVILGTSLHFSGSVLDLFLMLIPAALGAGLLLRGALSKKS